MTEYRLMVKRGDNRAYPTTKRDRGHAETDLVPYVDGTYRFVLPVKAWIETREVTKWKQI